MHVLKPIPTCRYYEVPFLFWDHESDGYLNRDSAFSEIFTLLINSSIHKMYLRAEVFIERCRFHSGTYLSEARNTACLLSLVGDSCRHNNSFDDSLPSLLGPAQPILSLTISDIFYAHQQTERRGVVVTNSGVSISTLSQGFATSVTYFRLFLFFFL